MKKLKGIASALEWCRSRMLGYDFCDQLVDSGKYVCVFFLEICLVDSNVNVDKDNVVKIVRWRGYRERVSEWTMFIHSARLPSQTYK